MKYYNTQQIGQIQRFSGIITLFVAILVLVGWVFDLSTFQTIISGWPSMKVNTALLFGLGGLVLIVGDRKIFRIPVGMFVVLIGFLSFLENLSPWYFGINQLFVQDTRTIEKPGLMSVGTSFCFIIFGLAVNFIRGRNVKMRIVGQYLLHLISLLSLAVILGYIMGMSSARIWWFTSFMEVHSATLFIVLSVSAAFVNQKIGVTGLLSGNYPGNFLARRMFLAVIGSVIILGGVYSNMVQSKMLSDQSGIIFFGLSLLLVVFGFIGLFSAQLNKTEEKRIKEGNTLEKLNKNLEREVALKTVALKDTQELLRETNRVGKIGGWEVDMITKQVSWTSITKMIHEVPQDFEPDLEAAINFYKEGHSRDAITKAINDAISLRLPWDVELQVVTARGREIWVRAIGRPTFKQGKCVKLNGTFQNINDRKVAELKAIQERELVQTIIDNIPINVYMKDIHFRRILVNANEVSFAGFERASDVLGKDDFELMDEESARVSREEDRMVFESGEPLPGTETPATTKDRRTAWFLTSKIPIKNQDGRVHSLLTVSVDMTDRKRNEEKLRHYEALKSKSEEMEQLTNIASHNFKESLNNVKGYFKLLTREMGPQVFGEDVSRMVGSIHQDIAHMEILMSDLLEYSRISPARGGIEVDLHEICKEVLEDMQPKIAETNARVDVQKSLPKMIVHDTLLKTLFECLISNAIKFRKPNHIPLISIGGREISEGWKFFVKDNGIGMERKDFEQVFAVFRQLHAKHEYPGTGMGLAIVRKIVELHDGKIWVESSPGAGSTFFFTLKNVEVNKKNKPLSIHTY